MAARFDVGAFSRDWAEARSKFVDAARRAGAVHREWPHPLRGPAGEALCCDTAWLGPRDAPRALVVISGTHGVEGFCGSGPQIGLLRGDAAIGLPPDTGVLLIHGINPHGWAWLRRVTEENVDLNRNWVDFAQPLPANPGYAALHPHLVPRSLDAGALAAADAACAAYVAEHGVHAFRVASSSGQYTHPDGWFYGGAGPTWARRTSEAILAEHLARVRTVAIVDMHTGLGPYGYGEPICNHAPGSERVARARAWWGDSVTEPLLGTSSSQEKWGLTEFGYERCLAHADIAFVALEFGTYPETNGRRALRDDHWLHTWGDPRDPRAAAIKTAIRDHFYPPHDDWKEMVLFRAWQVWRQALAGLATHHDRSTRHTYGTTRMNGAESLVRTLLDEGIDVCFTNPGTSEMHFVAALDRIPGMRCVLGLFEGVVTGAADGYWRIARRPASTLLHLGPGLANGLANLHNAKKAGSGIVNVVGEHARAHVALDAPLTADIEGIARPMSHWVRTIGTPLGVEAATREAVQVATTPPGRIATLVLPADCAWTELPADAPRGARIARLAPAAFDATTIDAAARLLRSAEPCALLLGADACHETGLAWAGRIAAATGCALLTEFPAACTARGAGRVVAQRMPYVVDAAAAALAPYRNLLLIGAREPVSFFAYPGKRSRQSTPGTRIVEVVDRTQDVPGALAALADALGARGVAPAGVAPRERQAAPDGPMTIEGIGRVVAAVLPEQAIVVDESVSSGRAFAPPTATAAPHDWLTSTGGAIGFGLPTAIGAAIAAPERKVLCLEGDGSAMYTVQSLWTMAREGLDVTVVVFANRAYRILQGEYAGVGAGTPGPRATDMLSLERPALDWVGLARSMGVEACRATDLGELARELSRGLASSGPYLIEAVI